MPWYRLLMPADHVAENRHGLIQQQFETFYRLSGAPADMAMFMGVGDPLGLYFTPQTEFYAPVFLRLARAEACERPTEDVALAVGRQEALDRLRDAAL